MEKVRSNILQEEEKVAAKSRFGLFSQPPPLAIGDNSLGRSKQAILGGDGKPVTRGPQLLAGACRTGMTKSSYFQHFDSVYAKEQYVDPHKIEREYEKKIHQRASFHQRDFLPSSPSAILSKPSFQYQSTPQPLKRSLQLDDRGKVRTKLPNVITNPCSKVQRTFLKNPEYISDPYNRKHLQQLKEKHEQKKKNLADAPLFKSVSHGNRTFQKNSEVYGGTSVKPKSERKSVSQLHRYKHDVHFVPACKGHGDPIGKYPEHQSQGIKNKPKKPVQQRQKWKPNSFGSSRPTPSVSFSMKNLKISHKYK